MLAVGPGVRAAPGAIQPLDVKVGDRVVFGKWSGAEVGIDGEDRVIRNRSSRPRLDYDRSKACGSPPLVVHAGFRLFAALLRE